MVLTRANGVAVSGDDVARGINLADDLKEIDRLSQAEPSVDALTFLLSAQAQAVLLAHRSTGDGRFDDLAAAYHGAVDRHLTPILLRLAEQRPVPQAEVAVLTAASLTDPIASAFTTTRAGLPGDDVAERLDLLGRLWTPFAQWRHRYLPDAPVRPTAVIDLWRLYLPFSQWIRRQKRAHRPSGLFMVGFNGSPGSGKTVLTNTLAVILNQLLDREAEGQAIARSGDDWYLGRRQRQELVPYGYDPGVPGVSNRALPGTHDLGWLIRNLDELEHSTKRSVLQMGNFDKAIDDQPSGPDRYFQLRGKVGVFLFDLWFAGAKTDVDPSRLPDVLRRKVAESLGQWRPVFDRMDALWSFDWPSVEQIVRDRQAQERLAEQRSGRRGMQKHQIDAFVEYMLDRGWDWSTTSPVPPLSALTFQALRDANHRVIAVRRGGRPS
jgi:pantothenate kinase-related protein Tda10